MTPSQLPLVDDFEQIFLQERPLLDVRAPVEFADGAFPCSENRPLLDDEQRHLIGLRYKTDGQEEAIRLGEALATEAVRQARIAAWADFAQRHPQGMLYCFRGGMRSKVAQEWLYQATGIAYPRIRGGYKAMRQFLIEQLDAAAREMSFRVIGGRTGSGKTRLLARIRPSLDLEHLAWHRGSAFGRHATAQPRQIGFENSLSIELLRHRRTVGGILHVEDESKMIGSVHLPIPLYQRLKASPLVILEASLEQRTANSVQEYAVDALTEYQTIHGADQGFALWSEYVLQSLTRIRKRLGGERHSDLDAAARTAIAQHRATGDPWSHADWIRDLLHYYYDPMYDYQISNNANRIIFRGTAEEIIEFLSEQQTD